MNLFPHLFATYFRRFRIEIAGWWTLSLGASVLAASGANPLLLAGLGTAEVAAALWLLVRLSLADDVFGTLAGRETRPAPRGWIWGARASLFITAFLPALIARGWAWSQWSMDGDGGFRVWFMSQAFPVLAMIAGGGLLLQLGATFCKSSRLARIATLLAFVCAAYGVVRHAPRRMIMRHFHQEDHGLVSQTNVDSALFSSLPANPVILTTKGHRSDYELPEPTWKLERNANLPLRVGSRVKSPDGFEWTVKQVDWNGDRLGLTFTGRTLKTGASKRMTQSVPATVLVRYGNGQFSTADDARSEGRISKLALLPLRAVEVNATFTTPAIQPWVKLSREELLAGAELWIFFPTDEPTPPPPSGPVEWKWEPLPEDSSTSSQTYGAIVHNHRGRFRVTPVLPTEEEKGLATEVDAFLSLMRSGFTDGAGPPGLPQLIGKGRRLVPHLLRWPSWSAKQWTTLVRPVLLEHSLESDLPDLTARLEHDPRLVEIFIAKGWQAHALEPLRKRLAAGLPLPTGAIELLAGAKDPALTDDLSDAILQYPHDISRITPLLQEQPGIDWDALVLEGWNRRKYGTAGEDWQAAAWAAGAGDRSALLITVSRAAKGRKREIAQMKELLPEGVPDALAYAREHLDALVYDKTTRRWQAAP